MSDHPYGPWMLGYAYIYIDNIRIGRHDWITTLRDAMYSWEDIYEARKRTVYKKLFPLGKNDIFKVICLSYSFFASENLECGIETFFPEAEDIDRSPGDFMFFPLVDAFDPWVGYLVSSGEYDKIIYGYAEKIFRDRDEDEGYPFRDNFTQKIRTVLLRRGVVHGVIKETVDYLVSQHEILKKLPETY
ncbi:hypothetical protein J3T99_07720 [Acetobacteraceae bacterium B3987]|nr:hypothetical protein [Acetobacteraceae bacterium B3987]